MLRNLIEMRRKSTAYCFPAKTKHCAEFSSAPLVKREGEKEREKEGGGGGRWEEGETERRSENLRVSNDHLSFGEECPLCFFLPFEVIRMKKIIKVDRLHRVGVSSCNSTPIERPVGEKGDTGHKTQVSLVRRGFEERWEVFAL